MQLKVGERPAKCLQSGFKSSSEEQNNAQEWHNSETLVINAIYDTQFVSVVLRCAMSFSVQYFNAR